MDGICRIYRIIYDITINCNNIIIRVRFRVRIRVS